MYSCLTVETPISKLISRGRGPPPHSQGAPQIPPEACVGEGAEGAFTPSLLELKKAFVQLTFQVRKLIRRIFERELVLYLRLKLHSVNIFFINTRIG